MPTVHAATCMGCSSQPAQAPGRGPAGQRPCAGRDASLLRPCVDVDEPKKASKTTNSECAVRSIQRQYTTDCNSGFRFLHSKVVSVNKVRTGARKEHKSNFGRRNSLTRAPTVAPGLLRVFWGRAVLHTTTGTLQICTLTTQ